MEAPVESTNLNNLVQSADRVSLSIDRITLPSSSFLWLIEDDILSTWCILNEMLL